MNFLLSIFSFRNSNCFLINLDVTWTKLNPNRCLGTDKNWIRDINRICFSPSIKVQWGGEPLLKNNDVKPENICQITIIISWALIAYTLSVRKNRNTSGSRLKILQTFRSERFGTNSSRHFVEFGETSFLLTFSSGN